MNKAIAIGGLALGGIATIGGIMALTVGGIHWQGFLGKQIEKQRYEIHKESQTYKDGMQTQLAKLAREYAKSESAGKSLIAATVRHQFSQTDTSGYPAFLQDFLRNEIGIY